MPEHRLALISRHVVLVTARVPQYAAVLITGETVTEVRILPETLPVPSTQVREAMEMMREWSPVDCEGLYISPGLVDINVHCNDVWESTSDLTKCAVSGGVTTVLLEPSLYGQTLELDALHCDVGVVQVMSRPEELTFPRPLALKTYYSPPSNCVDAGADSISEVLATAEQHHLPLIVDPSLAPARLLYSASPCRTEPLVSRIKEDNGSEARFSSGAFPESIDSSESRDSIDSDSADECTPERVASYGVLFGVDSGRTGGSPTIRAAKLEVNRANVTELRRRTLTEAISDKLRLIKADISLLSATEQEEYSEAGRTVFKAEDRRPVMQLLTVKPAGRFENLRPALLDTSSPSRCETSQDGVYSKHLATCPEHWETTGIEHLFSALQHSACRVHIANLSCAAAVDKVLREKDNLQVSCETCPHYLCISMENVKNGDTRLKTFPPIRSQENAALMWDLLKVGAIDIIASSHSSIPPYLKTPEPRSFRRALNGINCLGFSLQAVWTQLKPADSEHYFVRMSKWMSLAPAKLLGLSATKGEIKPGLHADLVVWDPYAPIEVKSQSQYSDMCAYAGDTLYGRVHQVYVRGQLAYSGQCLQPRGTVLSN